MSVPSVRGLQRYLRRLCGEAAPSEDAVLLERFVTAKDHGAFELLVARHGPMVLGTARRLVDSAHDAEDVFQAVFLSLARLAKSIRQGGALPAWLHRTTCRVAAKLRANRLVPSAARPERCEPCDPGAGLVWQEVRRALDEELQRLPERLRSPLLLCYLSGLTRDEAARRLGWSLGTLKRRLEEGRNTLRIRLERRGIAAVGVALTVLTPEALQAAVGKSLLDSTLRIIFRAGSVVPATVAGLVLSSAGTMKGLAMKSVLALLVAGALGVGLYASMRQADSPAKGEPDREGAKPARAEKTGERDGDGPLPAGSTLRFGTSRFRLGIHVSTLAVSADGKLAVAVNGNHVLGAARAFDLASGRVLYTIDRRSGPYAVEAAAISPDGRAIITKQHFTVHVREAATGKELRKVELPKGNFNTWSQNEWIAFTPDGKAFAVTSRGGVIHLIDFENGKAIRDFSNENPESSLGPGWTTVLGIAFSPDGKLMASGGFANDKGTYFARLWDVATGKELRRFRHARNSYGIPSLAFSPDAKTLATRSHDGRLRLFDVDTGRERKTFPPDGGGRRLGAVAFSPDGKTVAAAGDSIRLYDLTTGEERLCIRRKQATGLVFTDGGKTLTGAVMGVIGRWDTATGRPLTPEGADSSIEQVLVSADGSRVVTRGEDGDVHVWDGASGKHRRAMSAVSYPRGLAMSPDGRYLAWCVSDPAVKYTDPQSPGTTYEGSRIRTYDLAGDKLVNRFPSFKGDGHFLAFTSGGKKLVTVDQHDGVVRVWNVEAGKEERSFRAVPGRTALSENGRTLAVAFLPAGGRRGLGGATVVVGVWNVATGKEQLRFSARSAYVLNMALSPDGRWLATADEKQSFVWDTAAGKRVPAFADGLPTGTSAVAFSRDGRLLATALPAGTIRLWEVATWTVRNEYRGHRDRPTALTFAPAGQLLSGSLDTTVLAWDTRPPRPTGKVPLDMAWADLAKHESALAFKAEGVFLAAPADAVKLFDQRIKPVAALNPGQVRRWLADLGSDRFAVREAASKALGELDRQAIPYLEAALESAASLETQRRLERLLKQQQTAALSSEELRQIRAVAVLGLIGDGEAENLLKRWAGGPAGALLTTEATEALTRLKGASKTKRQGRATAR